MLKSFMPSLGKMAGKRDKKAHKGAPSVSERVLYWQPTGPNPLFHRDDEVDRPRAMGV